MGQIYFGDLAGKWVRFESALTLTETYSSMCLLSIAVGVKGAGTIAGNEIAKEVPRAATLLGACEAAMSLIAEALRSSQAGSLLQLHSDSPSALRSNIAK